MKRFFIMILAIGLLASLAGCGGDETAPEAAKTQEELQGQTQAQATETARTYSISITQIVEHPALNAMQEGFKDRMAELGIPTEYNVHIAQGDMAINEQIASQIKGEAPDLVVAITTPSVIAVAQKIKDIPIVFTGVTDPVSAKVVASLEAPGANVTGMTDMSPMDQHLALIRECVPGLKTLGIIYNAGETNSVVLANVMKAECDKVGVKLREGIVDNSAAVTQAAQSLVGKVDAVYVPVDNTVVSALEAAVKVCTQSQRPFFAGDVDSVARGAIAAVAIDYYKMGIQTADIAQKVLEGADTATLPVETIRDLSLHVNKSAAAAMGLTVPDSVLARAEKIIE